MATAARVAVLSTRSVGLICGSRAPSSTSARGPGEGYGLLVRFAKRTELIGREIPNPDGVP